MSTPSPTPQTPPISPPLTPHAHGSEPRAHHGRVDNMVLPGEGRAHRSMDIPRQKAILDESPPHKTGADAAIHPAALDAAEARAEARADTTGSPLARSSSRATSASDDDLSDDSVGSPGASARLCILMNEALADTPSFRAHAEYAHPQIVHLERWFDELAARAQTLARQIEAVKESAAGLATHCEPTGSKLAMLEHDYTSLALSRYGDRHRAFWSGLHTQSAENAHDLKTVAQKLKEGVFAQYHRAQRAFAQASTRFHEAFDAYLRLPPHSEPVAERDVFATLLRTQWRYVLAATRLVYQITKLETECSLALLETFTDQHYGPEYIYSDKLQADSAFVGTSFPPVFVDKAEASLELFRLRKLAENLRAAAGYFYTELKQTRQASIAERRPSSVYRDLSTPSLISSDLTYKTGWVGVALDEGGFGAYYAYVKNGVFGLLKSHAGTVLESRRFAVAECTVSDYESADRRFLFKIVCGSDSLVLQAVGEAEYSQWRGVLRAAAAPPAPPTLPDTIAQPWSAKYAITDVHLRRDLAPGSEIVAERARSVTDELRQDHYWHNTGMLALNESFRLAQSVPARMPVPTAGSVDAVVGNWYFDPQGTLNSIDANYWGCVGFTDTVGSHDEVVYGNAFPSYPREYPRKLIVQDMGMRAVTSHCAVSQRPNHDDLVLMLLRAASMATGHEAPLRVYATRRKLVLYSAWAGVVDTRIIELDKIAEIDCELGVDSAALALVLQNADGADAETLVIKLYVESAILVKKRLELLISNARSPTSASYRDLFEPLSVTLPESLPHKPVGDSAGSPAQSLGAFLYSLSIDGTSEGESQDARLAQGMHTKLCEDTFPISSKALFLAMFGPRSPVFNCKQTQVIECTYTAGPWYHRAKRLTRKITVEVLSANIPFGFASGADKGKYMFEQSVVCQTRDLFIVVEKRPMCETPDGDAFHIELKYFIYSTGQGSYLQIWSRTVWSSPAQFSSSSDAISGFVKMAVRPIALRTRETADLVTSSNDARDRFGTVHATYEATDSSTNLSNTEGLPSPRLGVHGVRWMLANVWQMPWRVAISMACWIGEFSIAKLLRMPASRLFIMLLSALSLLANYLLYHRMTTSYWQTYFDQAQADALVHALGVLPKPGVGVPFVFKRAIYMQEIDDAFTSSAPWVLGGTNLSTACAQKFVSAARLASWINDYGDVFEYEPEFEAAAARIADVREDFALTRNRLLTELWVLNAREREELAAEYRRWVVNEANMCAKARQALTLLNETVVGEIRQYCIGCLEEARNLI